MSLFGNKTSSPKKIFKDDDMDNTTISQLCGTSGHEELKSPAMVRAIQHSSKRSGSSGHGKLKSPAMDRAIQHSSKRSGTSGHGEVKSLAMDRAKEIQKDLGNKFPSFVKYMYNSHVNVGFLLSLNRSFCDEHLGKQDKTIFLVCEKKKKYKTKYLSRYPGLSGGWKGFSQAHKLAEGDVLVFHLTKALKFKVYIVRASETAEANTAVSLLNLHSQEKTLENNVNNSEMIAGEDMCGEGKASDSDHVAEGTTLDICSILLQFLALFKEFTKSAFFT